MRLKNELLGNVIFRDSAALVSKNALISIVEIMPINISELDDNGRQELAFQFQYFLRSLNFPIQIILRFVNKDAEKFLYRKKMADVEEMIKSECKKNLKEALIESDSFKEWLRHFLEIKARPMLLCYLIIAVKADVNLLKNELAYAEALQLLNQRTSNCIARLSEIKLSRKIMLNGKKSDWENCLLDKFQERKALLSLGLFRRNRSYFSLDDFKKVTGAKKMIKEFTAKNSYDEFAVEKEIRFQLKRLSEEQIRNLLESYFKDFVVLNIGGEHKYHSFEELFKLKINQANECD